MMVAGIQAIPDVDVGRSSSHANSSNQASLHELVGVVSHDLSILACARLALIGVDHEV